MSNKERNNDSTKLTYRKDEQKIQQKKDKEFLNSRREKQQIPEFIHKLFNTMYEDYEVKNRNSLRKRL